MGGAEARGGGLSVRGALAGGGLAVGLLGEEEAGEEGPVFAEVAEDGGLEELARLVGEVAAADADGLCAELAERLRVLAGVELRDVLPNANDADAVIDPSSFLLWSHVVVIGCCCCCCSCCCCCCCCVPVMS